MRRTLSALIIAATCSISMAATVSPRFEIGVILGEPTGISAKYWLASHSAIDAVAAWSFGEDGRLDLHADYLFHPWSFPVQQGELPVYFGLGAVTWFRDDWFIGARLPIGAQYLFDEIPLSLFAEIAPQVELIPDTGFRLAGGLGIRLAF